MTDQAEPPIRPYRRRRPLLLVLAGAIMLVIFMLDLASMMQGAVAVLYIIPVLLVAQVSGHRLVILAGCTAALLALTAFAAGHLNDPFDSAYVRLGVSLVAIAAATLLSLRDHSARTTLAEQARLLELSHDTVIIRNMKDEILYWNDGAESLYGWTRDEAIGRTCAALLGDVQEDRARALALAREGHWAGELTRTRRDGTRLTLASRWLLRRDPEGASVGIIESSADITEQKRADAERRRSERRYATIFNAAGFAIWESDFSRLARTLRATIPAGVDIAAWLAEHPERLRAVVTQAVVSDANAAAVALFEADSREALLGASPGERFAPGFEPAFAEITAALLTGAQAVEREVSYLTRKGRVIDVVLRVRLLPEGEPWSRVLMMALDVTERNEARAKLEQTSAELAHAARVSTLGQLAASIAHEVNQPLSAIITYGKSAKRWLARPVPDLDETTNCLDQIVANGSRAAEVIARVRALARKGTPEVQPLRLCELVDEAVALVEREARAAQIVVSRSGAALDVTVVGDRVQVQQVLVNLLMNAIQAMSEIEGRARELTIHAAPEPEAMMRVSVCDSGNGISGDPARIFEPFLTTKRDGMGMGLSICRSIIESQGGRISAANNGDHGATIAFTLPVHGAAQAGSDASADTSV